MFKQLLSFVFFLINMAVVVVPCSFADANVTGTAPVEKPSKLVPDHEIHYEQALSPDWKSSWDLARTLYHEKKYPEALVQYEILFSQKQNIEQARWEYVSILMYLERWKNAKAELERLLILEPASIRYRTAMARAYIETGDFDSGVTMYKKLLEKPLLESQKIVVLEGLVMAYDRSGKKTEEAETLEQLTAIKPLERDMLVRLAALEIELGRIEKAADICHTLEQSMSDDQGVLSLRARIETKRNNNDTAAMYWQKVAEKEPENSEANQYLSSYYYDQENWTLSFDYLKPLIRLTPNDTDLLVRAADLNVRLGRLDHALEYYDYALAVAPFNQQIQEKKKKIQQVLAKDLLVLIENEGGKKLWQDLDAVTPDCVGVYREMADLLRKQGKVDRLIEVLTVLTQQVPDDRQVSDELALLLEQRQ